METTKAAADCGVSEENTAAAEADTEYIMKACEAVLFACGNAVGFDKLAFAVGTDVANIRPALEKLRDNYKSCGSAIEVIIYDTGAQLVTKSEYAEIVRTALELRRNQPLSRAALEVLAVIAYNQPVTRAFIDRVRGVESPSVTSSLAEKGLIEEVGRLDAPGHPILYGTTPVFLRTFGLSSVSELENLPELEEIRRSFAEQNEEQSGEEAENSDISGEESESRESEVSENGESHGSAELFEMHEISGEVL